jgi:3D (Asp-Asp-Asp) domain-containing protein
MTQLAIALTGFFVWSGMVATSTTPTMPVQLTIPAEARGASRTVKLTAYNAVPEQTDGDPFTTASGAYSNPEVVAARSRDLGAELPFGTIIALENPTKSNSCGFGTVQHLIGYRVVADTMHERMQNKIDVLFNADDKVMIGVNGQPKKATNPARALGICNVEMRVVGKINIKDIPETQAELAMIVDSALATK